MPRHCRHVMLVGGGTGGHLFPALAVAAALRAQSGTRVTVCGTGRAWEADRVREAGFDYRSVASAPWSIRPAELWRSLCQNLQGYSESRRLLAETRPDCMIAVGGYSSVPFGLAAAQAGLPLVIIEPNVVPGRANRLLAPLASLVCVGFEATVAHFPARCSCVVTGVPIRAGFGELSAPVTTDRRSLLIVGGSQGARSLNRAVTGALTALEARLSGWRVIHQTGPTDFDSVRSAYAVSLNLDVKAFIKDMASAFGSASLAICRAGASTLAELAASRVASILVPYPHAAAGHQWHNACVLRDAGAARLVCDQPESTETARSLAAELDMLLGDSAHRQRLSAGVCRFARPHAAMHVRDLVMTIMEGRSHGGITVATHAA